MDHSISIHIFPYHSPITFSTGDSVCALLVDVFATKVAHSQNDSPVYNLFGNFPLRHVGWHKKGMKNIEKTLKNIEKNIEKPSPYFTFHELCGLLAAFCLLHCSWFGRAISITTADAPGARILDATIATILLHFTWQCVKTHGIPFFVHIKIAGIYGCSSP